MRFVVSICLIALGSICNAQAKAPLFRIGMSHHEVISRFGYPTAYFYHGQYFKSPPSVHGVTMPVYRQRVKGHLMEARIEWEIDPNSSRFSPDMMISSVHFAFDRPISAADALALIPEIAAECQGKCEMSGQRLGNDDHLVLETRDTKDGRACFEFMWIAADTVTERPVNELTDQVTEVWMHEKYSAPPDSAASPESPPASVVVK